MQHISVGIIQSTRKPAPDTIVWTPSDHQIKSNAQHCDHAMWLLAPLYDLKGRHISYVRRAGGAEQGRNSLQGSSEPQAIQWFCPLWMF